MHHLLKKNSRKINQPVTKIKHVLNIFPCLKYIYKSGCVLSSPLVFVVIGFYYLTNIYCSKFPTSELTGFITITYHNSDFWIKSNEEHETNIRGKERCSQVSLISLL